MNGQPRQIKNGLECNFQNLEILTRCLCVLRERIYEGLEEKETSIVVDLEDFLKNARNN
ncbi:hypothetical protein [Helicobacter pullorum]|uniref:hypothetical protein n=1 Tax=Helicobacter pullorum TaxID=35818 RepID=UPI001D3323FD|nr:hypothetical protein [Helicobacter pullorum]HJF83056.1 hypothetical protein [Helicobacter pullorum]